MALSSVRRMRALSPSLQGLPKRLFNHLAVSVHAEQKVAEVRLARRPVNSMHLDMLKELSVAVQELEQHPAVRGLVLTSNLPKIFSAGLDISEIYKPERARLNEFWRAFQDVWIHLYGTRLATVAAINGNSPAGGCILAISCDYRMMAQGNYVMGLSETQLGIAPSVWVQQTMVNTVGRHEAEKALSLGRLYSAEDALRVQLVDKLVPEHQLMTAAHKELQRWLAVPEQGRQTMKQQLRGPLIQAMLDSRQEDLDFLNSQALSDVTQTTIGRYLQSLKKPQQEAKRRSDAV